MTTDVAERSPAEKEDVKSLFKHATFVHVGAGADECPGGEDGSCENPDHFHGWLRKPNSMQHKTVLEHALAAKARRGRLFRDPDSTLFDILEAEVEGLKAAADRDGMVEELLQHRFLANQAEAVKDIKESEEFELIDRDWARLDALIGQHDQSEERTELEKHTAAFEDAVGARVDEIQRPQREALLALPLDELVDQVKDLRVEADTSEAFNTEANVWSWYLGCLRPVAKGRPFERVFGSVDEVREGPEEIVRALAQAHMELNMAALGNV